MLGRMRPVVDAGILNILFNMPDPENEQKRMFFSFKISFLKVLFQVC
jgi:hypothetical protein